LATAAEQIERAKRTLPFAWDRFSKIDRLKQQVPACPDAVAKHARPAESSPA
jgi:hypothetical protein